MDAKSLKHALDSLHLFSEKAMKLGELSFTRDIFAKKSGVTLSWKEGEALKGEREGPNAESIDAFVLTFRFFIQNNEKTSLANIASVYNSIPVGQELKDEVVHTRKIVNDYLDGNTFVNYNQTQLTRRTVMETFIYGGLSHANPEKHKQFEAWRSMGPFFSLMENEFVGILAQVLRAIGRLWYLNEKALIELQRPPTYWSV